VDSFESSTNTFWLGFPHSTIVSHSQPFSSSIILPKKIKEIENVKVDFLGVSITKN
jgi:hypothetical protein